MARPQKTGLDYFPLDVDLDDKIKLVESKHGIVGFGVVVKLWQKIYKNGYFIEWAEENALLFKHEINLDIETLTAIIEDCFKWKVLDKGIYEKYGILTSSGIQKRFLLASERKKEIELVNEYWLISRDIKTNKNGESRVKWVNTTLIIVNETLTHENVTVSTQSKVKESKVKESKEPPIIPLGDECDNSEPSPRIDYKKIVDRLNELAGTSFRASSTQTQRLIKARLKDGYTEADLITVVEKMCYLWNRDPPKGEKDMRQYLRPETIFGSKFEGYLNRASPKREIDPFSFEALGIPLDREMEVF